MILEEFIRAKKELKKGDRVSVLIQGEHSPHEFVIFGFGKFDNDILFEPCFCVYYKHIISMTKMSCNKTVTEPEQ